MEGHSGHPSGDPLQAAGSLVVCSASEFPCRQMISYMNMRRRVFKESTGKEHVDSQGLVHAAVCSSCPTPFLSRVSAETACAFLVIRA